MRRNLSVVQALLSRHPPSPNPGDRWFGPICPFFKGLTPPSLRTYSRAEKSCQSLAHTTTRDRFDGMAKGTFGERLKRERELREVTLDEVSTATRIAPRFLQALENEQWEQLPGGVFGRGFVRSIARYLGLNEEDLLSEYDLARGETANGAVSHRPEERIPSPPKWIPVLAGVLLIGLLVGLAFGGRYAWKAYQARRASKKSSSIVSIPAATRQQASGTIVLTTTNAGQTTGGDTQR